MLYKVIDSCAWNLKGYSNESYWEVLPVILTVYYAVRGDSTNFWVCGWNLKVTIQMKATEQYFPVVLFIMLYKVILTFESVDKMLKCDHSNDTKQYFPVMLLIIQRNMVLTCGAIWL